MWYSVNLLFKGSREASDSEPLWEETIRLVEAETEADAQRKAEAIALRDETSYSTRGDRVSWRFDRVERVCAIEDLKDGCELFSRFLRDAEVASLLTPFGDR